MDVWKEASASHSIVGQWFNAVVFSVATESMTRADRIFPTSWNRTLSNSAQSSAFLVRAVIHVPQILDQAEPFWLPTEPLSGKNA